MIWSSLIKSHMHGSHHVLDQNASLTPHFPHLRTNLNGSSGCSSFLSFFLFFTLSSLASLTYCFTREQRRHFAAQGRSIGTAFSTHGRREIYLCTLAAVRVLAELLNITRLPVSKPCIDFIVMLLRRGRVRALTPRLFDAANVAPPAFMAASGRVGYGVGRKAPLLPLEKKPKWFGTPASTGFNGPATNSLGLCDESVAECLIGTKLVTLTCCDTMK